MRNRWLRRSTRTAGAAEPTLVLVARVPKYSGNLAARGPLRANLSLIEAFHRSQAPFRVADPKGLTLAMLLARRREIAALVFLDQSPYSLLWLVSARLLRIPVSTFFHGILRSEHNFNRVAAHMRVVQWVFLRLTQRSLVAGPQIREQLPEWAAHPAIVPLAGEALIPPEQRVSGRGVGGPYDVLVAGGTRREKGNHLVLEALGGVEAQVRLTVVGERPKHGVTFGVVSSNVELEQREFVDRSSFAVMLAQADLVVQASSQEPFGQVAVEAVLSGVPVVVSDRSGVVELFDRAGLSGGPLVRVWQYPDLEALRQLIWAALTEHGSRGMALTSEQQYLLSWDRVREELCSLVAPRQGTAQNPVSDV